MSTETPANVPEWSRASSVLRLGPVTAWEGITPSWAFGGSDGRGVSVAVVDSGVEADHRMLEGAVDADAGVAIDLDDAGRALAVRGPHADAFGHGTACASIIHALAPAARRVSVRVLGARNTGKVGQLIAGLEWAVDAGFEVINLSLSTRNRDAALALHDLCDRAYFGRSVIVAAATNIPQPCFPSLYASVFSVASHMGSDPLRFHANPDPPTEFLARGIDVEVAWRDGGSTVATGNSFAAPHISGLAALILAKHRDLRPFQVKSVLWATAANVRESAPLEVAGRIARTRTAMGIPLTALRIEPGPRAAAVVPGGGSPSHCPR